MDYAVAVGWHDRAKAMVHLLYTQKVNEKDFAMDGHVVVHVKGSLSGTLG
jgi:hypothetical protein